jgi:hypothetical protein
MNLDRRSVLKNLLIIAGGISLVPSCMQKDESKTSIHLKNLNIDGTDEKLLAELSEAIIPRTDTPGAKDTYTHLYILKMVDDCRTKKEQKAFTDGLKAFNKFTQNKWKQSFTALTPAEREQILQAIQKEKDVPEDVLTFYQAVKGLTIQGYLSSKFYLSEVQVYELTPGRFKGCLPVSQSPKGNKQHV